MIKSLATLFNSGLQVFSEERRRHFEKEFYEKQKAVDDARNAYAPHYNRDKIALAEQALDRFVKSFNQEFDKEVKKLLALVGSEDA